MGGGFLGFGVERNASGNLDFAISEGYEAGSTGDPSLIEILSEELAFGIYPTPREGRRAHEIENVQVILAVHSGGRLAKHEDLAQRKGL